MGGSTKRKLGSNSRSKAGSLELGSCDSDSSSRIQDAGICVNNRRRRSRNRPSDGSSNGVAKHGAEAATALKTSGSSKNKGKAASRSSSSSSLLLPSSA